MSQAVSSVRFTNLIDLASEGLGGRALECSDDFFASMHNLVKAGPAVFDPDAYTDRGKLMDGWESRRKRVPGNDHCIVGLGARGVIRAIDLDTSFFLGNQPPFASVEAASLASDSDIAKAEWVEILPQSPLRPGSQNLFTIGNARSFTHLRIWMYPDGGIARLRVYGEVDPTWSAPVLDDETKKHVSGGHDLAAVINGGKALACSDAFFGPMDNLLLPGRAVNMGGGWETKRKRPQPGNDWILLRLGAPGRVSVVEMDTNHFKGNFPDRAALRGILAPGARITDLIDAKAEWSTIVPESRLAAHTRHFFSDAIEASGPFTHVRLDVYPDGGVSRLRVWGERA